INYKMPPVTKDIQLWWKFDKVISEAGRHAKALEGKAGCHMTELIQTMTELGKGFHGNWTHSWEDSASMQSLLRQQALALAACRGMQSAMNALIAILQLRMSEQQKRRKAEQRSNNFNIIVDQSNGDEPDQLFVEKHEKEIKMEPVEVKEEPLDDWQPGGSGGSEEIVKQEQAIAEPIVDTFHPCGSDDDPQDPVAQEFDQLMEGEAHQDGARKSYRIKGKPVATRNRRGLIVRGMSYAIVEADEVRTSEATSSQEPTEDQTQEAVEESEIQFEDDIVRVKCDLCDKETDKFLSTPTDPKERAEFLKRVIQLRLKDTQRVSKLMNNKKPANFCLIHIATRLFPGVNDLLIASSSPTSARSSRASGTEKPPTERYRTNLKPKKIAEMKQRIRHQRDAPHLSLQCHLCGQLGYPYHFLPANNAPKRNLDQRFENMSKLQRKFFDNMKELDMYEQAIMYEFIVRNQRATICWRHMKDLPPDEGEQVEGPEPSEPGAKRVRLEEGSWEESRDEPGPSYLNGHLIIAELKNEEPIDESHFLSPL
ncbi:hypothetical protein PMAYCL1PPCAC_04710, partial [Pristionchus mayeri]